MFELNGTMTIYMQAEYSPLRLLFKPATTEKLQALQHRL